MSEDLRGQLDAWREAGLIDEQTAGRILEYERRPGRPLKSRWPVILTLSLGALLIGAGVLLFVSSHWDVLSPAERMAVVVALVAGFHTAGASLGSRSPAMSSTMHALGTLALGAGIALTGQIFNMAEHWPSAVLLWAIGAAVGYLFLRDWPQFALLAILAPAWVASEWFVRYWRGGPASLFLLLLALVYLSAPRAGRFANERRTLCVMGSIAVLPLGVITAVTLLFRWPSAAPAGSFSQAQLSNGEGKLVASPATTPGTVRMQRIDKDTAVLQEPLAYFIPEHVPDPSRRPQGEELWVQVSVPSKGPPRPIRLGVKKDGVLTPLDLN